MTTTLPIASLRRDPRLQARAGVQPDVVEEYAEVLRGGGRLPAVRVVQDGEVYYLVDGWHRAAAHTLAGATAIECVVMPGEWSQAVAEAARANSAHGLRRTLADKRRAVRMLLSEPDFCGLSAREIARIANVSHTFVAEIRKHYGVEPGEVVTAERWERVDGAPPERWRLLLAKPGADARAIDAIRLGGQAGVLTQGAHWGLASEAVTLRRAELAAAPWPWPDTSPDAIQARWASLDTRADLLLAATSAECPDLAQTYLLAERISQIEGGHNYIGEAIRQEFAGRPAALAAVDTLDARRKEEPWARAAAVRDAPNMGIRAVRLLALDAEALGHLRVADVQDCLPELRTLLERVAPKQLGPQCWRKSCEGWVWAKHSYDETCVLCGAPADATAWRGSAQNHMTRAAKALTWPEVGLVVRRPGRPPVVVCSEALDLLEHLDYAFPDILFDPAPSLGPELSDRDVAQEMGRRGRGGALPAWIPEALRDAWVAGCADDTEPDSDLDEEVEEAEATWRREAGPDSDLDEQNEDLA